MGVRGRRDFFKSVAGATASMYAMAHRGNAAAQAPPRRQAMIGDRRVRVIDVHAHCNMPLGDVVTGTRLAPRWGTARRC